MAEYSFPFASVDNDRVYSAEDWRRYFSKFITNGVFPVAAQLQTTAGAGMTVVVSEGAGWINGAGYGNDSALVLAIDPADGILNRIDRIVLRWSRTGRAINLVVIKGTPASSPTAPAITRDADYYDLCIAQITVNAGITAIEAAHISDKRLDPALCGIVSSLITPDTSGWYDAWEAEYTAWLAAVQGMLEGDPATAFAVHAADTEIHHKAEAVSVTLDAANWTGASAPYSIAATATGVTSTTKGNIGLAENATSAERAAAAKAKLHLSAKGTNSVTILADGGKPTINIPCVIVVAG